MLELNAIQFRIHATMVDEQGRIAELDIAIAVELPSSYHMSTRKNVYP